MAEHKYAQVLRWIADGLLDTVHVRWGGNPSWLSLSERNEIVYDEIVRGQGRYEFRLAPLTITINGREIEAPVMEQPESGSTYYVFSSHRVHEQEWADHEYDHIRLKHGRIFATREAAQAAYDAITSLLLGKESA